MTKTKLMLKIESNIHEDLQTFILREYSNKGRKLVEVSSELGISRSCLSNFMNRLNIRIRDSKATLYGNRSIPTREDLLEMYSRNNITMEEIGKRFGFSRQTIWKFFKKMNIPRLTHEEKLKGRWSMNYDKCIKCGRSNVKFVGKGLCGTCHGYKRLNKELVKRIKNIKINEKQIIYGSLLGDGCMLKTVRSAFFNEGHCLKQEEYLLWKKEIIKRFNPKIYYKYKKKSGRKYAVCLYTEISPIFKKIREEFYINNKKTITNEILSKLEPLGLAVWFMDDGTLNLRAGGDISTDGFTKNENMLIKNYLDNLGVFCKVFKRKTGTYKIIINAEGFRNLVKIIEPYIHPSMIYKIDEDRRREYYYKNKKTKKKV